MQLRKLYVGITLDSPVSLSGKNNPEETVKWVRKCQFQFQVVPAWPLKELIAHFQNQNAETDWFSPQRLQMDASCSQSQAVMVHEYEFSQISNSFSTTEPAKQSR